MPRLPCRVKAYRDCWCGPDYKYRARRSTRRQAGAGGAALCTSETALLARPHRRGREQARPVAAVLTLLLHLVSHRSRPVAAVRPHARSRAVGHDAARTPAPDDQPSDRGCRSPPSVRLGAPLVDRAFQTKFAAYPVKYGLTFLGNLLDALGPVAVLGFGGWLVIHGQSSVGALLCSSPACRRWANPWTSSCCSAPPPRTPR
jgi:hypothetical protein